MNTLHLLRERGAKLDDLQIESFEDQIGVSLPSELKSLFKLVNGGEYIEYAKWNHSDRDLILKGLCPLEETSPYSIGFLRIALCDSFNLSDFIPFSYTSGGDLFLISKTGHIYFWNHSEHTTSILSSSLELFFNGLNYENPQSPFEDLCETGSFVDIYNSRHFDEEKNRICEEAARAGNLLLLKSAMSFGLPVGRALRFAAMNGYAEILDFLISSGQDINAVSDGKTILDWVVWKPAYHAMVAERGGLSFSDLPLPRTPDNAYPKLTKL